MLPGCSLDINRNVLPGTLGVPRHRAFPDRDSEASANIKPVQMSLPFLQVFFSRLCAGEDMPRCLVRDFPKTGETGIFRTRAFITQQ